MDIDKAFNEKVELFEALKKQITEINKKMGALQEEGRAIHMKALEVKGALETLAALKAEADAVKPQLTTPDHSIVAADGKTVIADANAAKAPEAAPSEQEHGTEVVTIGEGPARNEDGSLVNPPVALEVQ